MENKTWKEFRDTGLLTFVNTFLHIFGWVLVLNADENNNIVSVNPAKCNYTGFSEQSYEKAYNKVRTMLKDEIIPKD